MEQETIVAIATPPGRGGIGIVRLSGSLAKQIAEPMLQLRAPLEAGRARFGELVDEQGEKLDEVVATFFAAPHSYTSDDVVEIAAHGAPVVLEAIVRRAIASDARLARPGEFTERAFLSGRLDLTQAEAVRDLIEAQTLHQARVAAQQLGGALAERVRPAKEALVQLIAGLEAGIDFAEDDVDVMPQEAILIALANVRAPLVELAASYAQGRMVRDGITMAIVGRPNAGKSSLFNRLVERERAIVTSIAGTTRDLVTERVSLGGIPVELVDTAGIRESSDEAESIGIRKSREAMADADLVLLVLDATQPISQEERTWMEELSAREAVVVWNKIDMQGTGTREQAIVGVSALTGEGIVKLRSLLLAKLKAGAITSETAMLTNLRQQQAVQQAIDGLDNAITAVGAAIPHEMVLLDIYSALRGLDELTGATTADDVLNLIFSSFCIGK
ncbi:tRNA uridine-5-carboxymethylaminomethyl(34) synthesis GTPase MnmE [Terriglobus tenax]|uniref:tRNA uridine-5-carboxymethylaminomethyl(34) synthesis GTPase MnmE n=1 Tax=Terriglobus tenax TaxID=1111115 RepID=UPI0021DF73C4|nr:tRNA uridine-5-carboxymethylaminomethyl(34) synthesis GTPase MnmE [Terriglobus tenax]